MTILSEDRIQRFVEHAQLSLYMHERDHSYGQVMEFVSEIVDLMMEVRRERGALERIACMWDECVQSAETGKSDPKLAIRMCTIARQALDMAENQPDARSH